MGFTSLEDCCGPLYLWVIKPSASGENYSLLIMRVSNIDEDGGGVNGDGFEGNSSFRQGAGTETSVPRNWSLIAAALPNFLWMDADLI
jgi:hypothetical protein